MTVVPRGLTLEPVLPDDFESLLALRIRALRPSLEAIGRFDPQRARERFASGFAPEHMHHIVRAGQRVGCVTLRATPSAYRMDHLYIEPPAQGQGVGAWVMDWACALADLRQVALELAALKGSDANRFYQRHGLIEVGQSDFDIEYRRTPAKSPLAVVAALWARFEARDWVGARALLHDGAQVLWWASGEQLDGADAFIGANEAYPEGWAIHVQQVAALQDGRVLSVVRVDHAPNRFFANSIFTVRDGRIASADEYWGTVEAPPAWRNEQSVPGCRPFDILVPR
jgi:GNAT superfamily N-acetyltransferase/ketosteroid isomerase-like protein